MLWFKFTCTEWRCPLPKKTLSLEFSLLKGKGNQSDQRQIPTGKTKENPDVSPRSPAERFPWGWGGGRTWAVTGVYYLTVHEVLQAGSTLFISLWLGHHKSGSSLHVLLEVRGQVSHSALRGFLHHFAQLVSLWYERSKDFRGTYDSACRKEKSDIFQQYSPPPKTPVLEAESSSTYFADIWRSGFGEVMSLTAL